MGRVLAFPASLVVASLGGCRGITHDNPSVRACRDVSYPVADTLPDGRIVTATITTYDDRRKCRPSSDETPPLKPAA